MSMDHACTHTRTHAHTVAQLTGDRLTWPDRFLMIYLCQK